MSIFCYIISEGLISDTMVVGQVIIWAFFVLRWICYVLQLGLSQNKNYKASKMKKTCCGNWAPKAVIAENKWKFAMSSHDNILQLGR